MSRESAAACPLTADEQPLLAIARLVPERSVLDLREASTHVNNPARLAMLHWASCPRCRSAALRGEPDGLCKRGRHLLSRAHSWRARAGGEGGGACPGDTIASARAGRAMHAPAEDRA